MTTATSLNELQQQLRDRSWWSGPEIYVVVDDYDMVAANNPLLQAWFVRTGHPNGPDPYFLYASSNIGSFLALLSYPILLEPMFALRTQNLIWTGGYAVLTRGEATRPAPRQVRQVASPPGAAPPPPQVLQVSRRGRRNLTSVPKTASLKSISSA